MSEEELQQWAEYASQEADGSSGDGGSQMSEEELQQWAEYASQGGNDEEDDDDDKDRYDEERDIEDALGLGYY